MSDHHVVQELLGAYALDAVEAGEASDVEAHLAGCTRCRRELAEYREVIGLLAFGGGDAPVGVWDRIAAGMHEQPAERSLDRIGEELLAEVRGPSQRAGSAEPARRARSLGPDQGERRSGDPGELGSPAGAGGRRRRLRSSPRPRWQVVVAGVAAAAVAAALVLGVEVSNLDSQLSHSRQVAAAAPATLGQVRAALAVPGHRSTKLRGPGSASLDVVILPSGVGYVYSPRLRRLPSDRTYQLWGVVGAKAISYGLLGPDPKVEEFRAGAGLSALAVTDEVATGVVVSHQRFSVSGTVPPAS